MLPLVRATRVIVSKRHLSRSTSSLNSPVPAEITCQYSCILIVAAVIAVVAGALLIAKCDSAAAIKAELPQQNNLNYKILVR